MAKNRATERRIEARTARLAKQVAAAAEAQAKQTAERAAATAAAGKRVAPAALGVPRPTIVKRFIPFTTQRKQEMADYAQRHYGIASFKLRSPRVIVEHYTVSADAQSAINTFSADVADPELHELPGVCSHFVIDRDGTIYQLVPLSVMCRHTVGLNYTAIGVEHAGFSAAEVLSNEAEMRSSLALTRWLRCRYRISMKNVIGHNESLSSPYHHENIASLRNQTHQDWTPSEMDTYRDRLRPRSC